MSEHYKHDRPGLAEDLVQLIIESHDQIRSDAAALRVVYGHLAELDETLINRIYAVREALLEKADRQPQLQIDPADQE